METVYRRCCGIDVHKKRLTVHVLPVQGEVGAKPLEREFWRRRDVDVHELPLEQYAGILARYAGIELAEASA